MANFSETQIVESVAELWGVALQPAGCAQCGYAFLVTAERVGKVCPHCARGPLTAQPARLRPEPPELVIPFAKQRADLTAALTQFANEVWLRPAELDGPKLAQRLTPVYWPMWLVDADVAGEWQGEVGFDYQVKSSQEKYSDSGWKTNEVVETRIRWEPRRGQMRRHFDNVAAPAISDHAALIQRLGDFQLQHAQPYAASAAQTALLRVPDVLPENAWPLARTALDRRAEAECAQAAQGQHSRNFTVAVQYESPHWTQLLLPLYVTFYTDDDGRRQMIWVHGQTGRLSGVRVASHKQGGQWAGGLVAAGVAMLLLGLLLGAVGLAVPPLLLCSGVCMVGALPVGLAALVPALWPGQWNAKQGVKKQ